MPGVPNPLYVQARQALLDAADALEAHLGAITLVGAQAIYVHTGEVDLSDVAAIAPPEYTTDADFSLSPEDLSDSPTVARLLVERGFSRGDQPGAWYSPDGIPVDLMVPEARAGAGTRSADLGPHGSRVARRAKGLEGALVDRDSRELAALDPVDHRSVTMYVAGPGALLVAKTHKIFERAETPSCIVDKDALDVLRLLRAVDTAYLARRITLLTGHQLSSRVTADAIANLPDLFGRADALGVEMAVSAAGVNAETDVIAASMTALVSDLLATIRELDLEALRTAGGVTLD
jgi:hypothetical protein